MTLSNRKLVLLYLLIFVGWTGIVYETARPSPNWFVVAAWFVAWVGGIALMASELANRQDVGRVEHAEE